MIAWLQDLAQGRTKQIGIGILLVVVAFYTYGYFFGERNPPKAASIEQHRKVLPIATGDLISVTISDVPTESPETGERITLGKGCRVEVYEAFIIVRERSGVTHFANHGYHTGLKFK